MICVLSFASNAKTPKEIMHSYWGEFSEANFDKTYNYIHPSDLDELKSVILPIFLEAQDSKIEEVRDIVSVFFGKITQKKDREMMSRKDVYIGVHSIIFKARPELMSFLKKTKINITEVDQKNDQATLYYHLLINDMRQKGTDYEKLEKFNDKWFLLLKQRPITLKESLVKILK